MRIVRENRKIRIIQVIEGQKSQKCIAKKIESCYNDV